MQATNNLIKSIVVVLMVALSWVVIYQLNIFLFNKASISQMVSWIFLPAGIKIISVIIFDKLGVLGLFFGALTTYYLNDFTVSSPLILSSVSAISPYIAIHLSRYLLKLDKLFSDMSVGQLIFISTMYAIVNTLLHHFLVGVHMRNLAGFGNENIVMFCGDLVGTLLLLFVMALGIKYLRDTYKITN